MKCRSWIGTAILVATVLVTAGALAAWKQTSLETAQAAAAQQMEPPAFVTADIARATLYQPTVSPIGTVLALRSITLRNELAGTVSTVSLAPGQIVDKGKVLVALDVSVECAELEALKAEARLAETNLTRIRQLSDRGVVSEQELDRALAARDVAQAQIDRTQAIIERKTIRAPFRSRVGMADVHPGQYLNEGSLITTLQGIDDFTHVDFAVEQQVAAKLKTGDLVQIASGDESGRQINAEIVAVDARIDPGTRNAMVRARIEASTAQFAPGASVRVSVPNGPATDALSITASAIRKGPDGDHVFVLEQAADGVIRAHQRAVKVLAMNDDRVIVREGLNPGERVAAAGSFKLHEQSLVAIADNMSIKTGAAR